MARNKSEAAPSAEASSVDVAQHLECPLCGPVTKLNYVEKSENAYSAAVEDGKVLIGLNRGVIASAIEEEWFECEQCETQIPVSIHIEWL